MNNARKNALKKMAAQSTRARTAINQICELAEKRIAAEETAQKEKTRADAMHERNVSIMRQFEELQKERDELRAQYASMKIDRDGERSARENAKENWEREKARADKLEVDHVADCARCRRIDLAGDEADTESENESRNPWKERVEIRREADLIADKGIWKEVALSNKRAGDVLRRALEKKQDHCGRLEAQIKLLRKEWSAACAKCRREEVAAKKEGRSDE